METTTRDGGPGTAVSTGPTGRRLWRDATIIAATSAVLAFLTYAFWRDAATCDDGFACVGADLFAAGFAAVVVPVVAWVSWRLCRIPRAFLLAVATVAIGHVLADVVSVVTTIRHGFAGDSPLTPAPATVYVLVGVVGGLAATLLVGKGTWSRWLRVLVVVVLAVVSFAVHARAERLSLQHREDELRAVGVAMYLPEVSDRATPSYASPWSNESIHIAYHYQPPTGGGYAFAQVILVPRAGSGCGGARSAGYYADSRGSVCRETGDGFVADDGTSHFVAVNRGDTLLVLQTEGLNLDDAEIADSLREAPRLNAADLARL